MKRKISKKDAQKKIEEFFLDIKNKNSKDVKKIKRLAMKFKIPLKDKRKTFCKKCFNPYKNPRIRIKNRMKIIVCENCKAINKWKIFLII